MRVTEPEAKLIRQASGFNLMSHMLGIHDGSGKHTQRHNRLDVRAYAFVCQLASVEENQFDRAARL